jgi:hypothetical protein
MCLWRICCELIMKLSVMGEGMKKRAIIILSMCLVLTLALGLSFTQGANATVPGVNTLVSVNNTGNGQGGNGDSPHTIGSSQVISADGRYVAFTSLANNLVSGDTNGFNDVFVRDLVSNTTVRANVSASGIQANSEVISTVGSMIAISRTGRYVVFPSLANNLIDGQTVNGVLYRKDMVTGAVLAVTPNATHVPRDVYSVSSDGRFVVWDGALDTNLVSSETNTLSTYVYLTDLSTNVTTALNHTPPTGQYYVGSVSASCDGSLVAFTTKLQLSASDTDSYQDIYLADVRNGTTITGITTASNTTRDSHFPTVSCNGDYVVFSSTDANVATTGTIAPDTRNHEYLYDRVSGAITLAETSSSGVVGSGSVGNYGAVDDQGDVFFYSSSLNLVDGYTISSGEVYLKHRDTGVTELVSRTPGGGVASGATRIGTNVSSSFDGKTVVYSAGNATGTNLISSDTNGYNDVFASKTGL